MQGMRGLRPIIPGTWQYLSRAETRLRLPYAVRHYQMGEFLKKQSDHYSGTMAEIGEKIRERLGVEIGYHIVPKSRKHLLKHQPNPEQLPPRSMQDSYTAVTLPLSADEMIRERYINHLGRMRIGRLMEDMDMFAVWLCHRHVHVPELPENVSLPYTFVTLLVDRIEFTNIVDLQVNKDIELSGFVSWSGRTSMEITIYVRQLLDGEYVNVTKALFLMVGRNANNTGPAPVNKIEPANEMEQHYWEEAEKRQEIRKSSKTESVLISPPLEHEQAIMYGLLKLTTPPDCFDLNKRILPPKCRWMADSQRTTMMNPFPENRNTHNTIFGGYVMRQAVELSFIMASIYTRGRPVLKCISDISFMQPVKVTAFLEMTAHVVYTAQNYIQLMTVAQNWDAKSGENTTTNVFYFTYQTNKIVDEVLPGSYREMLWYIHGRRKFMTALNLQLEVPQPANEDCQVEEVTAK
ncbi:acyl-coenzyme A thioesterase 9, mitochondrial isoform X1 [Drosophila montana]|uniref:acyl-coenzyme A thioesterase 9, mitochondrial isoform X1 n=1 Tax=Drosophila montana TaxID=40370 RepID=UPI00313D4877